MENWLTAEKYTDVLALIKNCLENNLRSPTSWTYETTGSILAPDSIESKADFIKMNELGFLTVNSQPGSSKRNFYTRKDKEAIVDMSEGTYVPKIKPNLRSNKTKTYLNTVDEQRAYVQGFVPTSFVEKLTEDLRDLVLFIIPSDLECRNYELSDTTFSIITNPVVTLPLPVPTLYLPTKNQVDKYVHWCDNGLALVNLTRKGLLKNGCVEHYRYGTNMRLEKSGAECELYTLEEVLSADMYEWIADNTHFIEILAPEYGKYDLNSKIINLLIECQSLV